VATAGDGSCVFLGWVGGWKNLPAVPVPSDRLGVQRNHHAESLADTLQNVTGNPPVIFGRWIGG